VATSKPRPRDWDTIVERIRSAIESRPQASVTEIAQLGGTPFEVLISTMISLRTRDEVTLPASRALFEKANTPEEMVTLSPEEIAHLIYPAGFYRTKGVHIRDAAQILVEEFGGAVPQTVDELVRLPGVGRKTANLVLGLGFGIPAICVDTHVHRIPNRIGWIRTKKPEETEKALEEILPKKHWIQINTLLVGFGQMICTPQSPRCSQCPLEQECARVGVTTSR
jgi:endonuclease-3